jgi:thiol-disulfide isomerase/thioredoxin
MSSFTPGWGSVSDMILNEIDTYLGSSPPDEGLSEACYYAGLGLSMKYPVEDVRRSEMFTKARTYLERATPGTEFHAAAEALITINGMKSPFADQEELRRQLRELVERHPGDARLYRAVSTGLNHIAASVLWPVRIDAPDIEGKTVTLDEYMGKVLLIDFWATWCMPCRKEIPNLVDAYKAYNQRGFEILSICLDSYDRITPENYREVARENGMKWRHIYDGRAFGSDLVRRFFVGTIPAPFLVGPDGSLFAWGKDCREDKLARNVEKALESIED